MRIRKEETARPPYPRSVRWWTSLRVGIAGRRDARSQVLPEEDGHLPFTRRLAALSHTGHTEVGHWLHTTLDPIDRAIAGTAETIADTRRNTRRIDVRLDDIGDELGSASSFETVRLERESAGLRKEREDERKRASSMAARLADLLAARRVVIDRARSAVAAWNARYDRLVANYRRGYLRRHKNPPTAPAPTIPPYLGWTAGDLPLLMPIIDPEVGAILNLTLTAFDQPAEAIEDIPAPATTGQ